jgi:hypothetical protein
MLSTKDKQGIWVIAGVFGVLVAVLLLKMQQDSKPKPGPDNCVGLVAANTVVVLDHTERISEQTLEEIVSRAMAHVRDHVKVNERVTVFTVSDLSKQSLKPLLSICRPPESGNRAVEDVRALRKRFQENFEKPLRQALAVTPGDSKESPIAQAITDISLSQYLRGDTNTLLVFSDMLENTQRFTLYRCKSPSDTIARYRESRRGAMERPQFKNTLVALNLIPRMDQPSTTLKCRDQLWPWFFGDNDGPQAKLNTDYLPGGTPMDERKAKK